MSASRPIALSQLSFAGQLLVWTTRKWVGRDGTWRGVASEFAGPFGPDAGRDLAAALDDLYTLVDAAAIRPMVVGPSHCRRVWRDEGLIVRLVELEQHRRSAWTFSLLEQIVPAAAARRAIAHVSTIASLLDGAGYRVSMNQGKNDTASNPSAIADAEHPTGKITMH